MAKKRQEFTKKKLNKTRAAKRERQEKERAFYEELEKRMNDRRVDDILKGTRNG